jgi:hypothetical protein
MGSRMIGDSLEGAAKQPAGQQERPRRGMQQDVYRQKLVDGNFARYHKIVGSPPIKVCSPALRGW